VLRLLNDKKSLCLYIYIYIYICNMLLSTTFYQLSHSTIINIFTIHTTFSVVQHNRYVYLQNLDDHLSYTIVIEIN